MAGPLALNLIANYSLNIVSLSFVGKLGDTQQLAAAALGTTLSAMSGGCMAWQARPGQEGWAGRQADDLQLLFHFVL